MMKKLIGGVRCKGKGVNCNDCNHKSYCTGYVNMNVKEKPPLGLVPHDVWELERLQAIKQAMGRYANANMEIPKEWIDEYIYLSK